MKSSRLIRLVTSAVSFAACCGFHSVHPGRKINTNKNGLQNFHSKPKEPSEQSTTLCMSSIGSLGAKSLRKKKLKPFVRYLEVECWKRDEIRDLEPVLQAVAEACKTINRIVQRAKTDDLYGVALEKDGIPIDGTNIQGEVQQKLDILCNTIMMRAFCGCSSAIHSVASEEEDEARCCADVMGDSAFAVGNYIAGKTDISNSSMISIRSTTALSLTIPFYSWFQFLIP